MERNSYDSVRDKSSIDNCYKIVHIRCWTVVEIFDLLYY